MIRTFEYKTLDIFHSLPASNQNGQLEMRMKFIFYDWMAGVPLHPIKHPAIQPFIYLTMKNLKFPFVFFSLIVFLFAACDKDDDDPTTEQEVITTVQLQLTVK